VVRGALAGIAGAAAWAAAEPLAGRLFRTPYSDARLLGRPLTEGRWRPLGIAVHLANGALFGALFERVGGRGVRQGVAAAVAENLAFWPGMAIADRLHPDRRSGDWPPLLRNGRVFAYETSLHVLFGAVLGTLLPGD
jgi:hypothetical protein